jgi:CelD/BcsL family acetyltransferase involved in cellulose biosynthesis
MCASHTSVSVTVIDLPQRGPAPRNPLTVELYDRGDLAAADWPSIAGDPDLRMYVFQSREFLDVWLDTIGKTGRIECYLIVVRDGDARPVLYLPLAIETKFNVRLLRFMDCGVADYNAPIVVDGRTLSRQEFTAIWSEILARLPSVDVIDLKKIANDVSGAFNPLTYLDRVPFGESGHAMLLTDLRGKTDRRPSVVKLKRHLRRYHRGLGKFGEPRFVINPTEPDAGRLIERLFAFKRHKYARTNVPDFLAAPGVERFYRAIAAPGRLGGISHLSALTVGDTVASAHLGFIGRGRFYYIFPAYDTAYKKYRVGHLLLQHLIDRSGDGDLDTFDLGIGDLPYKDTWATHQLTLTSHERAVTAAGRLYLQMRRVRRFVNSAGLGSWLRTAS